MMKAMRFQNRSDAGSLLAAKLSLYAHQPDVVVLGLPRGGVPVAYEVAHALGVPLDIMVVRKLGVPGARELAMGALASGGICLENHQVVASYRIPAYVFQSVVDREERELERRERLYRGDAPALDVHDRTIILVDDGIATGSTVRAALAALRLRQPTRIIVATPVAAAETVAILRTECDELVSLLAPEDFFSVGAWYDEFAETGDEEIRSLLDRQAVSLGGRTTRESNVPAREEPPGHEELGRM
jgi:putative phosphoribosyl transferase